MERWNILSEVKIPLENEVGCVRFFSFFYGEFSVVLGCFLFRTAYPTTVTKILLECSRCPDSRVHRAKMFAIQHMCTSHYSRSRRGHCIVSNSGPVLFAQTLTGIKSTSEMTSGIIMNVKRDITTAQRSALCM